MHNWYLFPHSFTGELVHALIGEWKLGCGDCILDPFVGTGTTLVAAKERCVHGTGYDLSPLAVLSSNTKVASLTKERLETMWAVLREGLGKAKSGSAGREYPELVRRALPGGRLAALDGISRRIGELECSKEERDFLGWLFTR